MQETNNKNNNEKYLNDEHLEEVNGGTGLVINNFALASDVDFRLQCPTAPDDSLGSPEFDVILAQTGANRGMIK